MIAFVLKIWTFIKKYLKWILAAIALIVIIILGSVSGSKGQQLKDADVQIQVLQQQVITQQELIQKLAAMESVHCEVTLTVKNTAVMGSNHSGTVNQEAEQIATYLRGEILEKMMADEKEITQKDNPEKTKR
ncbi:MAG: hypothetical protein IKQ52_09555 [Bacteroidales bacterium]|nr:hypothetical protein [Bacteroidales bacterium]MBR6904725.1 hypothetical protein [Bacteroidales bacterium]